MDCVFWVVSEDPPGEQAYDFLFQEASSACSAGADQMDWNRVQRSNFCQNQRVFCRSIYIVLGLNFREEYSIFEDPLFSRLSEVSQRNYN